MEEKYSARKYQEVIDIAHELDLCKNEIYRNYCEEWEVWEAFRVLVEEFKSKIVEARREELEV